MTTSVLTSKLLDMMRHQCKLRWYMLGALERDLQRLIGSSVRSDLQHHINELVALGLVRMRAQVPVTSHSYLVPPEFSSSLADFYQAVPSPEQALVQERILGLYREFGKDSSLAAIQRSYIERWGSEHLFRYGDCDVVDFRSHVDLLIQDSKFLS